ncbi:DC-STAMP domain-containing protein 2 [Phlebotomus argentipes]|uniref:DC-STAMP domain-containing protein 2 n=1 Tax=Phlebotomus argentipes TaxID=94469 RepID=UPI002892DB40|nr:DC-STAMP domain-containing protein 2 [Phlebotomus argentipes]
MCENTGKSRCKKLFQEMRKRRQFIKLVDKLKTLLISVIFTGFLYQTLLYRFNPPFLVVFLLFFLAFFTALRWQFLKCFMILLIPMLVTKRGRSAIVGYIFVLTLSGSVANIMRNVEETVACLSCSQEHLKELLQGIIRGLKRPFGDIKQLISRIQDHILVAMKEIEDRLNVFVIFLLVPSIRKAFAWLEDVSKLCQRSYGSPFKMCVDALNRMIAKCEEDLGSASVLCSLHYLMQPLCIPMEVFKFMCIGIKYIGESALNAIEEMAETFSEMIKKMFHFNLEFDSDFDFETTASRNWTEIRQSISKEFRKKTEIFASFVGFMEILSLIFIIWLFYKVFRYQVQYLKRDDYRNCYITREFLDIEAKSEEQGRKLVLPLRGEEEDRYTEMRTFWLIRYERRKLFRSFPFLLLSNIQIFTILFTDFSLHWILAVIRDYEEAHLTPMTSGYTIIEVNGTGPLAEMYRGVVGEFEPMLKGYTTDFRDCLPNPSPPDLQRFRTIIILTVICWAFLLLEPFSLRIQQLVMDSFHPERARKRSAWLHAEILRQRKSFLTIAAQKILHTVKGEENEDSVFR